MKYLFLIPRTIWKLWFITNFVITLLLLYPFFWCFLLNEKWYGHAFQLMRIWAKWLCYGSGIFPSVKYEVEQSKIPSPSIIVANHSSYLDIVLSFIAMPNYFIFVGKQEINKAPLFRIFFKKMNILVNRKSVIDSHRAYVRAGEEIDKGRSVFIFPEATISSKGHIIPFKNGAFKLAIDKQIPIVPIVYFENWKLLQNGGFLTANGRPGIPRIVVKEPVHTKGLTNTDLIPLRERVKVLIQETLQKG